MLGTEFQYNTEIKGKPISVILPIYQVESICIILDS